ncbi:hypothetical protein ONZ43_g5799 [Nemania bipapillata]|uniref:Uncharacterized protein n=1 Tax=Nemania bipapillata TaxID=110536 RepID=A0ACC2I6D9_9PEZI|nr:hypothetical protein ONZ43_g5799 [Nemania bipapillata]
MADARALLRAHRAENRIKHPHAAYSDVGKLLCKLCHDVIKTESLWDAHVRGQAHRQKLQALQQQPSPPSQATDESTHKRKRSEDADAAMSDADDAIDAIRTKRSRTDTIVSNTSMSNGIGGGGEGNKEKMQTPPGLSRRISGTPIQGNFEESLSSRFRYEFRVRGPVNGHASTTTCRNSSGGINTHIYRGARCAIPQQLIHTIY